ncbi:outer membrane channel protein TolC [Vibrio fluvialis]|uniref:outer membrane channel protein TolC n=1 Tax=Vibrio fluvialis TaxID=676 RepID=UPI001F230EC3|nr:outer membrane channel protein TolC [Vibrio fluvialis]MCE7635976.1 outer membrane channel protein TolC [Vibrio fluvialis]
MKKLLPLLISATLGGLSTTASADDLAQIYDQAKQNDPQLLSAAAQRDAAFEAINSSRSSLLPQINLTAGYNINRSDVDLRDSDKLSAGINFSQELYDRSSWVSLDTAEKQARQADAQYANSQQSLMLRVAQAYFDVLSAQDNLEFVRAEKAAVGRQLEQTKQRFEVGLSAITDVHDAQAQYDTVLADEVLAENSLINSYESLREITGQEHTNLSILDTNRFSTSRTTESMEALIEQAQEKNLSLLSARISQDVAKDNISLASSGHLPSLTLDGGYNYGREYNDNYSSYDTYHENNDFNIGLNLTVPLYSGGNVSSQTKQAEYAYVAASQDLEASYRSVVKNVRAYEQSVISAQSALDATEAGFDVGTRTIVDVLDATRTLYSVKKNLSDARYSYIINVLQLRQAVGTLSEQDIIDVNAGLKAIK